LVIRVLLSGCGSLQKSFFYKKILRNCLKPILRVLPAVSRYARKTPFSRYLLGRRCFEKKSKIFFSKTASPLKISSFARIFRAPKNRSCSDLHRKRKLCKLGFKTVSQGVFCLSFSRHLYLVFCHSIASAAPDLKSLANIHFTRLLKLYTEGVFLPFSRNQKLPLKTYSTTNAIDSATQAGLATPSISMIKSLTILCPLASLSMFFKTIFKRIL
jgi:hypothetical protein